jgi:L-alanine-DL-glutamate epimerase-like enolase superfamily enzyme
MKNRRPLQLALNAMPAPVANNESISRRGFFGATAGGALAALADPGRAAAQAVGVKPGDLPDLTIQSVKVYVLRRERIASIVTASGIEGNYTLNERYWHPNWSNAGWLEYAKRLLTGRSVLELPALTSQWEPSRRRVGQSSYASAIDNCLWDILGKAVGLPVYRLLGAYRDKVLAYASSQHHPTVEAFVEEVKRVKALGYKAYKIHPPDPKVPGGRVDYKLDMEVNKAVRQAAGDDFLLLNDPVGVYTREEAIRVGRQMDELGFVAYEDPIPTTDMDGLVELCRAIDTPIHIGEFIFSIYDYAAYIRAGALDVVRLIVDNIGGITGGLKVAHLAECFGLECAPHNWGGPFDHAVHFHLELAMPNNVWFEMTQPMEQSDRPYIKDKIRIDAEGYVHAPTKPGLGYEIDRNVLENLITAVET